MPKPVSVDLAKLVKTSALINPEKFRGGTKLKVAPLPSIGLIEKEIALQMGAKQNARLAETNLLIEGNGTEVVVASKETMAAIQAITDGTDSLMTIALDGRSKPRSTPVVTSSETPLPEASRDPGTVITVPQPELATRPNPAPTTPTTLPVIDLTPIGGSVTPPTDPVTPGSVAPLAPIAVPPIPVVGAPGTGLTGTYQVPTSPTDAVISTNVVAADVGLTGVNSVTANGTITADKLNFDVPNAVKFNGVVRANSVDGRAGSILFSQPLGAYTVKLEAPVVSALSINAATSIEIRGELRPVNGLLGLRTQKISVSGGINANGANGSLLPLLPALAPQAGGSVVIESNSVLVDTTSGGIATITANGSDAPLTSLNEGGDGGAIHLGTDARPIAGNVTVKKGITATTGANATGLQHGGKGGSVSIVSSGTISVQETIKVSDSAGSRASKQGGHIRLDSRKTSGTAISISNSGQLHSLLSAAAPGPGGKVEFVSAGGDISVQGGSVLQADRGTVDLRNVGAGNITLKDATLRGDVVKANVLGAKGQLIIDGGSINADTALKLYASGSNGSVIFKENTSLNGNSVKTIAGNTVTIDNGKVVTINGPSAAKVHTNNANYTGSGGNGSKSGTFGGKGASTHSFDSRPGY